MDCVGQVKKSNPVSVNCKHSDSLIVNQNRQVQCQKSVTVKQKSSVASMVRSSILSRAIMKIETNPIAPRSDFHDYEHIICMDTLLSGSCESSPVVPVADHREFSAKAKG